MTDDDTPTLDDFEWPHETKLWASNGSVDMSLQPDRVRALGWTQNQKLAFWPVLDGRHVVWDVGPADSDDLRNAASLRMRTQDPPEHVDDSRVGSYENAYLRWPREFAVERGLFDHADAGDATVRLSVSPRGDGDTHFLRLEPWPPSKPFVLPAGRPLLGPYHKQAVDSQSGVGGTKTEIHLPQEVVAEMSLDAGQPVAGRLTAVEGRLALAFDVDVGDDEADAPYVRRLVGSTVRSEEYGAYESVKLRVSRPYAHALGIAGAGVQLTMRDGCLVVQASW